MVLVPCYNLFAFIYLLSTISSKKEVVPAPIPIQVITTTSLTDQYVQRQTTRLLNTYTIDDNRHTYSENIDAVFYSKSEWTELLKDENNYLEKKWRTKILIENTPRGNIFMHYDAYKMAFAYYSDQTVPYPLLNAVAMKYVLTFFCRDFFMDEIVLPETNISRITTKHKEDVDAEKAKMQKENGHEHGAKMWRFETKENEALSNTKSPFAKFKSYNNVSAKSTNISNTSNTAKNGGTKEITLAEPKQTNRFVYLGKTRNVSFLQKHEIIKDNVNIVFNKIETTESGSLNHSGIYSIFSPKSTVADFSFEQKTQESTCTSSLITQTQKPKQQMTYAEYKRLL